MTWDLAAALLREFGLSILAILALGYGAIKLFLFLRQAFLDRIAALESSMHDLNKYHRDVLASALKDSTIALRDTQASLRANHEVLRLVLRLLRETKPEDETETLERIEAHVHRVTPPRGMDMHP